MSVVFLQEHVVHYEVLGRGRSLIFLHGWVGSWRYWIPAMQTTSISYRTYALDMWGFGDTAKLENRYSLDEQVKLVDLFQQEMGMGRVALIGHGLGAIVALAYANRYLHLVDRLMLIGLPDGERGVNSRLNNSAPGELADWLVARTPEGEAARTEAIKADQRAIQASLEGLESLDLVSMIHKLDTLCLMVYGQNDPVFEGMPGGELFWNMPEHIHQVIFDQSGHFPMLEEPRKFNRLLVDFLSLTSGTSLRQLQLKEEWKRRMR